MRIRIPALVSRFKQFRVAVCATLCLLVGLPPLASAQSYSFIKLGPVSGRGGSVPEGINNAGQVVGWSFTSRLHDWRATLWNGTTPTDLGTMGGFFSNAYGINNAGQVVGLSGGIGFQVATLWNGTTPTNLGTLGGSVSRALSINDAGQAVGISTLVGDRQARATLWNGTTPTELPPLGGKTSEAYGINNAGQVVGWSSTASETFTHPTLWNGTTPTELPTLGGQGGTAFSINDAGQAVGDSRAGDGIDHATLWNGTTPTDLGIGGAFHINNRGQVVGFSYSRTFPPRSHATLWDGTTVLDLHTLLDFNSLGWTESLARDINDHGQIVGYVFNDIGQDPLKFAFLLTPIDTTPPVLTVPASFAVDATSPAGAIVDYTVTATDNSGVAPTVSCLPPSGATFPIGPTTVNCTATDAAGNSTPGSLTVTVNGPVAQLSNLISLVGTFNNPFGKTNSLDTKLQNAIDALSAMKGGNASSACNLLSAFINEAQAQSGNKLTVAQANLLIESANRIRAVLGCQ